MTTEQIIKELEKERNHYLEKLKDENLNPLSREYYDGQATGIRSAICWLKYLEHKKGV